MATVFKRGGKANRGGFWYVQWFDHNGKRRTKCTRTTDKAAADRIAAKYDAGSALRREGVIDPHLDATATEGKRTIESHLADYEARMKAAARNSQHVAGTLAMIRATCEAADFQLAADLSADGVNLYAGKLKEEGYSARTIQAYLTAMKGFSKWLALHHKLPRDPLAEVRKPNPKADRRHTRRMLLPDEWKLLRTATLTSGENFGMKAAERVLLYTTAIQTGLRSSELRSLTRGRLFLDAERPYVVCGAGSTKNQKDACQYIRADIAADLRRHVANKTPQAPLFTMPAATDVAKMFRADLTYTRREWLKAAKQDPEEYQRREKSDFLAEMNDDKATIDFHALRHTCGAWLAMSGVHPKVVQTVMRHSSITLTLDTYGHLFPGQEADAVAQLGKLLGDDPQAMQATGTDGNDPRLARGAQHGAQHNRRGLSLVGADACDEAQVGQPEAAGQKSLRIASLSKAVQASAAENESRAAGTRTPNQQIMSLLL